MYNFNKNIFLSFLILSCGSNPLHDSALEMEGRGAEREVFSKLKQYVENSPIEFPAEYCIKIQNLAPWAVSVKNIGANTFKISDYKDYVEQKGREDFYCYHVNGEGKNFLISPYIGIISECSEKDGFLFPECVHFRLDDGNFASMHVTYDENSDEVIFTLGKSCIHLKKEETDNPFILDKCHVDINEINSLCDHLSRQTALPFIKYFYDCYAAKNGAKITYFDKNYFSPKFNYLGDFYINIYDKTSLIKEKLELYQGIILSAVDEDHKLYCMKIFIEFPIPSLQLEAVKHTILLAFYEDKWFIIDSNGGDASYYANPMIGESNFKQVVRELGITLCNNEFYEQTGNGCDTCASMNSVFLSSYLAKNGKLNFTQDGDIDFAKILDFGIRNKWLPRPKFLIMKKG